MPRPDGSLEEIDDRIAWVLRHPASSPWLKSALKTALERDPLDVINELEILTLLLRTRRDVLVKQALGDPAASLDTNPTGTS